MKKLNASPSKAIEIPEPANRAVVMSSARNLVDCRSFQTAHWGLVRIDTAGMTIAARAREPAMNA
jgi:hypothetical protein